VADPVLDPALPRGGMTANQVADLALRCGRVETELELAREAVRILTDEAAVFVPVHEADLARIAVLEAALRDACRGREWRLRAVGVEPGAGR
jgi:hypothetical protein